MNSAHIDPHPATRSRLSEGETRFRTMADHAPVLLWMARPNGLCEFFNQGWLDFTGRSMAQELGTGWAEGVHPGDLQRCMHLYFECLVARKAFSMEYRLRRHDGVYRWIYDQGTPRYEPDGTFAGFIGSCVDVTEQRQAHDALAQLTVALEQRVLERTNLARERETLLREVHHRVKNDLQLISSILSMQERRIENTEAIDALADCNSRVQTIASIHEHMYNSANLQSLSLSEHVRSTAAGLFRIATLNSERLALDIQVEDGIQMRVDRAVPCGMILNELLRNALKHAFPDGRPGAVCVKLERQPDARVVLTVSDDGVGVNLDARDRGSLGWRLVQAFAEQLDAEIFLDSDSGFCIAIAFSADDCLAPQEGERLSNI